MKLYVIHLHPEAPPKPAQGMACNGCGMCCATEPCPLGIVASLRRQGRCAALDWDDAARRYTCGLLTGAARAGRWPAQFVARWIAAGMGCDAALEVAAEAS